MSEIPDIPTFGSPKTLVRFFLRLIILTLFAALSKQGFGKTLPSMLILATVYCAFAAAIRREHPFAPDLTHFDEAAAYAIIADLAAWVS